jgi:hypothetical protein
VAFFPFYRPSDLLALVWTLSSHFVANSVGVASFAGMQYIVHTFSFEHLAAL